MQIEELSLKWAEFRYKLMTYEEMKERELQETHPLLSQREIAEKVSRSVDRKFKREAEGLLKIHLSSTS